MRWARSARSYVLRVEYEKLDSGLGEVRQISRRRLALGRAQRLLERGHGIETQNGDEVVRRVTLRRGDRVRAHLIAPQPGNLLRYLEMGREIVLSNSAAFAGFLYNATSFAIAMPPKVLDWISPVPTCAAPSAGHLSRPIRGAQGTMVGV